MMDCAARHGIFFICMTNTKGVNLETEGIPEATRALGLERTVKKFAGEYHYQKLRQSGAFDLLQKCLELDADKRISAKDAVHHPFFEPVRSRYASYF
jgi:serine/threonine protein kinase